jgi:hypothetical protein
MSANIEHAALLPPDIYRVGQKGDRLDIRERLGKKLLNKSAEWRHKRGMRFSKEPLM